MPPASDGLLRVPETVGRMAALVWSLAANRLELASLELEEQKLRLVSLFIWTAALIFFGVMAAILTIFALLISLEGTARLVALWATAGVSIALFIVAALVVAAKMRSHPLPFAQTVEEMKKDGQCL